MRLQLQRIDVNHDLPVTASVWRRNRRSGNTGNLIPNRELQIVVELGLVQALTFDRQQADGKARGIHAHYNGRKRALREPSQIRHRKIGNLSHVGIGIRAWLKVNFDQTYAGHRTRFHVVDSASKREKPLKRVGDIRFNLLRRHAAVKGGYHHHGNVDRWKHVHRHLSQAVRPRTQTKRHMTTMK